MFATMNSSPEGARKGAPVGVSRVELALRARVVDPLPANARAGVTPAVMLSKAEAVPSPAKSQCQACSLKDVCLPCGLAQEDIVQLDELVRHNVKVKRGEHLYRAGDPFQSIYAIRTGFFKTYVLHEDGREQVTGFHMAGEVMGMDAVSLDAHSSNACALEDCEVCVVPFAKLEDLGRAIPAFQRHVHRMMSREIVRDQGVMLLLGTMRAEERVATFLLHLSQRLRARGYSASEFHLRMTREEIGSYLGLKLETVSRVFSKFQQEGLLGVEGRSIVLKSLTALRQIMGREDDARSANLRPTGTLASG